MNSLIVIGIYKLTNIVNGRSYVGQSRDIANRMKQHIEDSRRKNNHRGQSPLYDDMRLYGHDKFKLEVLEVCSDEVLDEREQYYIRKFDTANSEKGYNRTEYAVPFHDPRIIAESHSPKVMRMHGKRIREWNLEKWKDPEYRGAKSKASSELQIERLECPEYYAKKKADLKKATDRMRKTVEQYDKEGNLVAVFDGAREASRKTGIHHDTIARVAKGHKYRKTAGGYVWKYPQEKV